jgi:hypothetical protein
MQDGGEVPGHVPCASSRAPHLTWLLGRNARSPPSAPVEPYPAESPFTPRRFLLSSLPGGGVPVVDDAVVGKPSNVSPCRIDGRTDVRWAGPAVPRMRQPAKYRAEVQHHTPGLRPTTGMPGRQLRNLPELRVASVTRSTLARSATVRARPLGLHADSGHGGRAMILCAAGDIHGALDRLFEDVLAFRRVVRRCAASARRTPRCRSAGGDGLL